MPVLASASISLILTGVFASAPSACLRSACEDQLCFEELGRTESRVALIDTGANDCTAIIGRYSVIGDDPQDDNGHGTSMASEISSFNENAEIISIKALDSNGRGSAQDVYEAVLLACDLNADVICMPFSSDEPGDDECLSEAVSYARSCGIEIVGSAGNAGAEAADYMPANLDGTVSAGALNDDGEIQPASNRGEEVDRWVKANSTSDAAAVAAGEISRDHRRQEGSDQDRPGEYRGEGTGSSFSIDYHAKKSNAGDYLCKFKMDGGSYWFYFYKTNSGVAYYSGYTITSNYAGPILVGSTKNACVYHRNADSTYNWGYANVSSVSYNGATCYYSNSDGWIPKSSIEGNHVENIYMINASSAASRSGDQCWDWGELLAANSHYSDSLTAAKALLNNISFTQTVQARYQDANGNYGGYSNVVSSKYVPWATVSWSRAQDATYNAASITSFTAGDSAQTKQVSVSRRTATNTIQARYENADGSWGSYSNVSSGTNYVGATRSWSQAATDTYQAASASITGTASNQTKQVSVYRRTATNTIQVRYQNADGSWGSYSNASSGSDRVGQVRSWSRAADATYKAASTSITGTASAQTKQVSVYRQEWALTVNPMGGYWNSTNSTTSETQLAGFEKPIASPTKAGYGFAGWASIGSGKISANKMADGAFTSGITDASAYDNNGTGTVSLTSRSASDANPIGTKEMLVASTGTGNTSPGLGGWYRVQTSAAGHVYNIMFVAKAPVGYRFHDAMNATGDGRTVTWLTSNAGTGRWETYAYQLKCGTTGTFSTFGHNYLTNDDGIRSYSIPVAYSDIVDVTSGTDTTFTFNGTTTIKALWHPHRYTVAFDADGGQGEVPASFTALYDTSYVLPDASLVKTGYTFDGWVYKQESSCVDPGVLTCSSCGSILSDNACPIHGTIMSAEVVMDDVVYDVGDEISNLTHNDGAEIVLFANYAPHEYDVVYHPGGGTGEMEPSGFTYGQAGHLSTCEFEKAGFTFSGWAVDPGGEVVYGDGEEVENLSSEDGGTVDLYAKWRFSAEVTGIDEFNPDEDEDGYGDNLAFSVPSEIDATLKSDGSMIFPTVSVANLSDFTVKVSSMSFSPEPGWALVSDVDHVGGSNLIELQMTVADGSKINAADYVGKTPIAGSSEWMLVSKTSEFAFFEGTGKGVAWSSGSSFATIQWYLTPDLS